MAPLIFAGLNILICTPGRLLQHMDETPNFDPSQVQILVLDEADRILDMVRIVTKLFIQLMYIYCFWKNSSLFLYCEETMELTQAPIFNYVFIWAQACYNLTKQILTTEYD